MAGEAGTVGASRALLAQADEAKPETTPVPTSRFWRSAAGFWLGPGSSGARLLTAGLIGATILQLALQYRLNFWSRDFFDAFGRRDSSALWSQAALFLLLAGLSVVTAALLVWARMTTQRRWRAWLTRQLLERWLSAPHLHDLHFQKGEDENPEYRIAEDARVATDSPVNLVAGLLTALLSAIIFISVLWNVGGDLDLEVYGHTLTVPKYLVITVVLYSALLTITMTVIGRNLTNVIEGKNAAEAQFRSIASHLREATTSTPPRNSDSADRQPLDTAFNVVIARWRSLCFQLMRTTLVSHGNFLAAPIIGWVLCAPKYLVGTMSLGEVAQAVAAFVIVQTALNWLVDNYAAMAECLSSVNRVAALLMALEDTDYHAKPSAEVGQENQRRIVG